jgi:hypothetical protein
LDRLQQRKTKYQSSTRKSIKPTFGCEHPTVGLGATRVKTIIKRKNANGTYVPL